MKKILFKELFEKPDYYKGPALSIENTSTYNISSMGSIVIQDVLTEDTCDLTGGCRIAYVKDDDRPMIHHGGYYPTYLEKLTHIETHVLIPETDEEKDLIVKIHNLEKYALNKYVQCKMDKLIHSNRPVYRDAHVGGTFVTDPEICNIYLVRFDWGGISPVIIWNNTVEKEFTYSDKTTLIYIKSHNYIIKNSLMRVSLTKDEVEKVNDLVNDGEFTQNTVVSKHDV